MKRFVFLFVGLLFTFSAYSQQDSVDVVDFADMSLEELMNLDVTTASKFSQKISDAPAAVFVITSEQIKSRNYSCLRELLNDIPQVEIQSKSASESSDVISINGISGNEKFVILMDGVRINSTTGFSHTIGESYSLANVKQVEIILGPASALYGADAFTGIINIKTFTGAENQGLHLSTSYGMWNTTDNSLVYGLGNDKLSFVLTGKYYHSDEVFFPDYYDEFAWYNTYKQTGEMWMFGSKITTNFPIQEWGTPHSRQASVSVSVNKCKSEA